MADLTIDNAVADAEIGGGEKIPVSDGGNPRSVTTEKLKDFVLQRIAALTAAQTVDANTDGVYLLKGGELKPVSAAVLAAAVLDYAFALTSVAEITGNEKVSVKDANSKKTISLDALKSWLQSDTVTKAELTAIQNAVANKVDAEDGKVLSSNDFTDADKEKIGNIADPVQCDWEETDSSKISFIKNKPAIPEPIVVDQILDENSSNPVSNSAVASVTKALGVKQINFNGSDFFIDKDRIISISSVVHYDRPPDDNNVNGYPLGTLWFFNRIDEYGFSSKVVDVYILAKGTETNIKHWIKLIRDIDLSRSNAILRIEMDTKNRLCVGIVDGVQHISTNVIESKITIARQTSDDSFWINDTVRGYRRLVTDRDVNQVVDDVVSNKATIAKMYSFSTGNLPKEGSVTGIPHGAFIMANENSEYFAANHQLLVNIGDENSFKYHQVAEW